MEKLKNSALRKIIYLLLFSLIILGFLGISKKYEANEQINVLQFSDYYENESNKYFKVINGNETIRKIKQGKHIIFIGNSNSKWSKIYAHEINRLVEILINNGVIENADDFYYYDLSNDKQQKNSKYYDLRRELKGALVTTDTTENNLLTPVLYIVENGEVKYYNIETVAMKNTDDIDSYWTEEQELSFEETIIYALEKYYLN